MSTYRHTSEEARIRHAIGTMPYGARLSRDLEIGWSGGRPAPVTLDRIAEYLEGLRDALEQSVDKVLANEKRLRSLENQRQTLVDLLVDAMLEAKRRAP